MLYNEFIEGTGCKDNEKNYKVYKDLEIIYMNSEISKAEIYEYGKKLVDNSKSEKELAFEAEINEKILKAKEDIENHKINLKWSMCFEKKDVIAYHKNEIKRLRNEIKGLKFVLS